MQKYGAPRDHPKEIGAFGNTIIRQVRDSSCGQKFTDLRNLVPGMGRYGQLPGTITKSWGHSETHLSSNSRDLLITGCFE